MTNNINLFECNLETNGRRYIMPSVAHKNTIIIELPKTNKTVQAF